MVLPDGTITKAGGILLITDGVDKLQALIRGDRTEFEKYLDGFGLSEGEKQAILCLKEFSIITIEVSVVFSKAPVSKTTFRNLAPNDMLGTPKFVDIQKIMSQKVSGRFNYVVKEDGSLVIGKRFNTPGGGHIDLAGGKPVQAAGEVKFVNGKVKFINNKSGHYQPSGEAPKNVALEAFGVDDEKVYIEKIFK